MKNIRDVFNSNIKLLGYIAKAVNMFRQGRYDEALGMVAESGEAINLVSEAILQDRDYFGVVSDEATVKLLSDILEAKKHRDYILLADLYELQLSELICNIQEYILEREDFFDFDIVRYNSNIAALEQKFASGISMSGLGGLDEKELERLRVNRNAELESSLAPEELLEKGYSVEFTSCGLMTLRAPLQNGESIYLHTNGNITEESFLVADRWRACEADTYYVFGLGMGYHIKELLELEKFAKVVVFEDDINILKLFCAFGATELLGEHRLGIVYDPDRTLIEKRLATIEPNQKACIHYPSLRRGTIGEQLLRLVPFAEIVERC